jgi:DNA polymerase-3 subunit gamma/tau
MGSQTVGSNPTFSYGGGGHAPQASAAPQAAPHSAPVLQSFQAIVDLAAEKRDIGLKHALENGAHLVAFEAAAFNPDGSARAGRIELRLVEGQSNLAQDLTRKLREWTGQNWVVSLSQAQGAATIGAVKQSAADRREEAALKDPFVQSALAAFPQAEIISISDFEAGLPTDDGEMPYVSDGDAPDGDAPEADALDTDADG